MTRRLALAASLVAVAIVAPPSRAGDGAEAPKSDAKPAKEKPEASKGPEIAWVRSYPEAREESMERNVAIYVHSHGST